MFGRPSDPRLASRTWGIRVAGHATKPRSQKRDLGHPYFWLVEHAVEVPEVFITHVAEALVEGLGAVVIVSGREGEAFGAGLAGEGLGVLHERGCHAAAAAVGRDI